MADTEYIRAGECGQGVTILIGDDGGIVLQARGQLIPVDAGALTAAVERTRSVAALVARSATPISGMSPAIERSLANIGCSRVTISETEVNTNG